MKTCIATRRVAESPAPGICRKYHKSFRLPRLVANAASINRSAHRIRTDGLGSAYHNHGDDPMKTYRVSRLYRWSWIGAKVVLTIVAGGLYLAAVTHPTPLALRLILLAGLALFGWLFYVRFPKVPTEITVSDDGWVSFRSSTGTTRVQAADIRLIGRSFGRRTLRGARRRPNQRAQSLQETCRPPPDGQGPEPIARDSRLLNAVACFREGDTLSAAGLLAGLSHAPWCSLLLQWVLPSRHKSHSTATSTRLLSAPTAVFSPGLGIAGMPSKGRERLKWF